MEFSDKTIVLRVGGFRESDIWLRLLSPERGVFSAFAFGGGKSRRRFSGCLDLFNEVLFQVKKSRHGDYLALQEGVLLHGPDRLRRDWRRMGMARNCACFVEAMPISPDNAAGAHALFADLLNSLEGTNTLSQFLPLFFRTRLLFEQGYAFNPDHCGRCGRPWAKDEAALLPLAAQAPLCRTCAAGGGSASGPPGRGFILPAEAIKVLHRVVSSPLPAWDFADCSLGAQQSCARAMDGFLRYNVGLYWENGRFRQG
ncbi:MAG: DNA repair protein RecO [Deltaproteobacteria bacterium]|jgi:DNA repair protein RecO (recombination protein O)|nr:DNA repair protein RecO [Deltaproteobacteria bacterium]